MEREGTGRTLKTTRTSLQVLQLVLEYNGLTLAELDNMLDKAKSSLHSHLRTLEGERYLVREGDTYRAGYRVALLGEEVKRDYPVTAIAPPVIEQLAQTTGKEANFTLLEHGRLLLVHAATGDSVPERETGYRTEYYLHNTAAGRAIMAEMDRDRVERIIEQWGLPRATESTITERDHLFEVLAETTERGYGFVDKELAPQLVSVGAAVSYDGEVIGGISVGGPSQQTDLSRLEGEIVDSLFEAADTIERKLESE